MKKIILVAATLVSCTKAKEAEPPVTQDSVEIVDVNAAAEVTATAADATETAADVTKTSED